MVRSKSIATRKKSNAEVMSNPEKENEVDMRANIMTGKSPYKLIANSSNPDIPEGFVQIQEDQIKYQSDSAHVLETAFLPFKYLKLSSVSEQMAANSIAGLRDQGCLAVVLQAIVTMPGLKEYFLCSFHLRESSKAEKQETEDNLTNRIGELMQIYHSYNDCIIDPVILSSMIDHDLEASGLDDSSTDCSRMLLFLLNKLASATNRYVILIQKFHRNVKKSRERSECCSKGKVIEEGNSKQTQRIKRISVATARRHGFCYTINEIGK